MAQHTRGKDLGLNKVGKNGTSGSFASRGHKEGGVELDLTNWGSLDHLREPGFENGKKVRGSRTPWGEADSVHHYAPGVAHVGTGGHGGIKLSAERNKAIPPYARQSGGWYEEDQEFIIPAYFFRKELIPSVENGFKYDEDPAQWDDYVESGLRNSYPDIYEKTTGTILKPGESRTKDEAAWHKSTAGEWKVRYATSKENGMVEVGINRGNERRKVLMTSSRYSEIRAKTKAPGQPSHATIVEDPDQYETPVETPRPEKPKYFGLGDLSKVTPAKINLVRHELAKLWRSPDGSVRSLQESLEDEGVTDKYVNSHTGKREYNIRSADGSSFRVSKATWDIAPAPDTRTAVDKKQEELNTHNADPDTYDFKVRQAARAKRDRLQAELKALREQEVAARQE